MKRARRALAGLGAQVVGEHAAVVAVHADHVRLQQRERLQRAEVAGHELHAIAQRDEHAVAGDQAQRVESLGDPVDLGQRMGAIAQQYPHIDIWGGCCGTWDTHLDEIARNITRR